MAAQSESIETPLFERGKKACLAGDERAGVGFFRQAAAAGDERASFVLGNLLVRGSAGPDDSATPASSSETAFNEDPMTGEALRLWALAETDERAAFIVGLRFARGLEVERDGQKARRYLGLAAEKGHAAAMYVLAELLEEGGVGVAQNCGEAFRLYEAAGRLGHGRALLRAGECMRAGRGTDKSKERALEAFVRAADLFGVADAAHNAAVFFADGKVGEADQTRAAAYYQKAAPLGHAEAQLVLAHRHMAPLEDGQEGENGGEEKKQEEHLSRYGVDYNAASALRYANMALKALPAQAELTKAKIHLQGGQRPQALVCLRSSTSHEQPPAEACYLYAHLLETSMKPDFAAARMWYKRAADAGSVEAMAALGAALQDEDAALAADYLRQAAEHDHPVGCCRYGSLLRARGQSAQTPEERTTGNEQALFFLTKACLYQQADAMIELALMYQTGSTPPDPNPEYAKELLFYARTLLTNDIEFQAKLVLIWGDVLTQLADSSSSSSSS